MCLRFQNLPVHVTLQHLFYSMQVHWPYFTLEALGLKVFVDKLRSQKVPSLNRPPGCIAWHLQEPAVYLPPLQGDSAAMKHFPYISFILKGNSKFTSTTAGFFAFLLCQGCPNLDTKGDEHHSHPPNFSILLKSQIG